LGLWRKWYHLFQVRINSIFAQKIINTCQAISDVRKNIEKINIKKLITIYTSYNDISSNNLNINGIHFNKIKFDTIFRIGYIGRMSSVKRIDTFIIIAKYLLKKLINFKIILVGEGPELVKLKEDINLYDLDTYFDLPGYVKDTTYYYSLFDVFVLPSVREGLSLSLIEAGANNIPLIAFDVGGNSEIIIEGKNGFLIPDYDVQLLVEKIILINNNINLRKYLGNNASKIVNEKFSLDLRIKKLEKVYREISISTHTNR
jgi:glycosyltransferase involved in cell wall biosynthesis